MGRISMELIKRKRRRERLGYLLHYKIITMILEVISRMGEEEEK